MERNGIEERNLVSEGTLKAQKYIYIYIILNFGCGKKRDKREARKMRQKDGRLWEPAGCLPSINSSWARAELEKACGFVQGMPEKKIDS